MKWTEQWPRHRNEYRANTFAKIISICDHHWCDYIYSFNYGNGESSKQQLIVARILRNAHGAQNEWRWLFMMNCFSYFQLLSFVRSTWKSLKQTTNQKCANDKFIIEMSEWRQPTAWPLMSSWCRNEWQSFRKQMTAGSRTSIHFFLY